VRAGTVPQGRCRKSNPSERSAIAVCGSLFAGVHPRPGEARCTCIRRCPCRLCIVDVPSRLWRRAWNFCFCSGRASSGVAAEPINGLVHNQRVRFEWACGAGLASTNRHLPQPTSPPVPAAAPVPQPTQIATNAPAIALPSPSRALSSHVLLLQSRHLDRPAEVVGIVDAHERMGHHQEAMEELQRQADLLGAERARCARSLTDTQSAARLRRRRSLLSPPG
jgi:hypothetical protein